MSKLRVATLCSGMDTQCMALDELGIDYELVLWSEFDPDSKQPIEKQPAVIAHNAVYPQYADRNLGDMTKIDWKNVPDFDLLFTSTPCQSISAAGKREGIEEGSGTRSSIMWHARYAVVEKRPKYIVMENVDALVQRNNIGFYNLWRAELESYGYAVFAKVLNAADFNVPQTRKRVFIVAILGGHGDSYRFPTPVPLTRKIRDIVVDEIPQSLFLKKEQVESILSHCDRKVAEGCGFREQFRTEDDIATAINTKYGQRQTDTYIKQVYCLGYTRDKKGVVVKYTPREIANTVHCSTGQGGDTDCFILEPLVAAMRGRNPENPSERGSSKGRYKQFLEVNTTGTSNTLTSVQKDNLVLEPKIIQRGHGKNTGGVHNEATPTIVSQSFVQNNFIVVGDEDIGYTVRRFADREIFRLMSIPEANIDKIFASGIPSTSLIRLAGNAIVVDCLKEVLRKLLCAQDEVIEDISLF